VNMIDLYFYPQVRNKPCVKQAYVFILEFSTVANGYIIHRLAANTEFIYTTVYMLL
jgi:hypothetical protein